MPYGHLIAATVMTLGVCQGRSSIASFSILTSASRGPSAIAEFLVTFEVNVTACDFENSFIGPILWDHSSPLCHALSLSLSLWTSILHCHSPGVTSELEQAACGGSQW